MSITRKAREAAATPPVRAKIVHLIKDLEGDAVKNGQA
jgi:hypothetical protein